MWGRVEAKEMVDTLELFRLDGSDLGVVRFWLVPDWRKVVGPVDVAECRIVLPD